MLDVHFLIMDEHFFLRFVCSGAWWAMFAGYRLGCGIFGTVDHTYMSLQMRIV